MAKEIEILTLPISRAEVLQEVDGDLVEVRQVDAHVDGQEVVHLALAAVLGGEALRGDLHPLRRLLDLLVLSLLLFHGNVRIF